MKPTNKPKQNKNSIQIGVRGQRAEDAGRIASLNGHTDPLHQKIKCPTLMSNSFDVSTQVLQERCCVFAKSIKCLDCVRN